MADIILITGGARSGKSDFALKRAERLPGRKCFVATSEVFDKEMEARVEKHRLERDHAVWTTIEEPLLPAQQIGRNEFQVYLLDCMTLWISNLMAACEKRGEICGENEIRAEVTALIEQCRIIDGTVLCVTNEVGLGIVPDNPLARRYRDLVGRCNAMVAAAADEVVLVSCGLPIFLKKKTEDKGTIDERS